MDDLGRVIDAHPLPEGWSAPECFADEVELGSLVVSRVGLQSEGPAGLVATGSAAQPSTRTGAGIDVLTRAFYELHERVAILASLGSLASDDPRRRPARSNGVALHTSWPEACEAARLELVERDRVLRSWYCGLAPKATEPPSWLSEVGTHRWRAALLEEPPSGDVVAVLVGFPRSARAPLTRGFAARHDRSSALEAAANEALQSLAFLVDEEIPSKSPELSPTPIFHLDHFLVPSNHSVIEDWLESAQPPERRAFVVRAPRFVDLSSQTASHGLWVARAVDPTRSVLFFGEPPAALASHVPPARLIHPIA